MVTPEAILRAAEDVQYRTRAKIEVFRCAPQVHYEVMRWDPARTGIGFGMFGPAGASLPEWHWNGPVLISLMVVVDSFLPERAWRLCDADQTLLYDCREGTHALD